MESQLFSNQFFNRFIPHVGISFDASPLVHFIRDLLLTLILCLIGYRDFQAAFTTMLASAFLEVGNGIAFQDNGEHAFFDLLDFLPSVIAGFLITSLFSDHFDLGLLLILFLIYLGIVLLLILLNLLLKREIIFRKK